MQQSCVEVCTTVAARPVIREQHFQCNKIPLISTASCKVVSIAGTCDVLLYTWRSICWPAVVTLGDIRFAGRCQSDCLTLAAQQAVACRDCILTAPLQYLS